MTSSNKQVKIRLQSGTDDRIDDWLQQFRDAGLLTDVLRMLIYRASGEPMPDNLVMLARRLGLDGGGIGPSSQPDHAVAKALIEAAQAMRDVAVAVSSGQVTKLRAPPDFPPEIPVVSTSSGIDMSRPRQRIDRSKKVEAQPDMTEDFDPVALGQLMAQSIRNAQPGRGKI